MYWAHIGEAYLPQIEMASMDGKYTSVVHDISSSGIISLTIDYRRQMLYWIRGDGIIEHSSSDRSNRRIVSTVDVRDPYDLAVFDDTLYLTEPSDMLWPVKTADVNSGNATGIFRRFSCTSPESIAIVSEQKQQIGQLAKAV